MFPADLPSFDMRPNALRIYFVLWIHRAHRCRRLKPQTTRQRQPPILGPGQLERAQGEEGRQNATTGRAARLAVAPKTWTSRRSRRVQTKTARGSAGSLHCGKTGMPFATVLVTFALLSAGLNAVLVW